MNKDDISESIEVNGRVVLALVHVMGAFRSLSLDILKENGIENPEDGEWYPLLHFLQSFDTMMQRIGPNTLSAVGRQIVAQAPVPPNVDSPASALSALDTAYQGEHRGGDVGHYHFVSKGPRNGLMISTTPYPENFDRGLIRALVEKFDPDGLIDVHMDSSPESMEKGASARTYSVSW